MVVSGAAAHGKNVPARIAAVHLYMLPIESAFPERIEVDAEGREARSVVRRCAVRSDIRGRAVIVDASPAARAEGIRPGMTVSEARARMPELEVRDRDVDAELAKLESAAELLLAYGSIVEVSLPSFLFVEVGRSGPALRKVLGEDVSEEKIARHIVEAMREAGHEVTVAIAKDPDTARTVVAHLTETRRPVPAEKRREVRVRGRTAAKSVRAPARKRASDPPGRGRSPGPDPSKRDPKSTSRASDRAAQISDARPEPSSTIVVSSALAFLSRLPLEALLWTDPRNDPDGLQRERLFAASSSLRVLGIHDVARLKTLPSAQLASRFGAAGALLVDRAYGRLDRPLRPFTPSERMIEELELESAVEDLEPILFVLRRIFARLEARLEARALSAGALMLAFAVEPHLETAIDSDAERDPSSRKIVEIELRFARPTRKASTMLALAREKLGNALPGAVRALVAEVRSPTADFGAQLDLFSNYPRKLEQVGELVGRLEAALGSDAVFSPELKDTHRPEAAWTKRPFEIERALEEPSERPSRAKKPELAPTASVLESTIERKGYMLPSVSEELSVAEMPADAGRERSVEAVLAELTEKKKSWPKAIERKVEDDPLPALPPRPLELFQPPERVSLYARREGERDAADSAVLVWRGERIPLRSMSGCERLEAEWWTPDPLAREYVIAESDDGRKLWLFYDANGDLFMHGVFD